ncbi:hypothetical protein T459_03223 [Capsicum annuum]|uniref:Endonuclease/exonuclease/phosphatase domain-containing protein n=1 Tax=Capsicum annuum TaxID=4072 RepID=A0A2G3AM78_CAPAN|nr:hypothetical protein T459_03223 [Capsicum annuum]
MEVSFTMLETAEQYIHGELSSHARSGKFLFTAVYDLHTIVVGLSLWTTLRNIYVQVQEPWLIMGDFNAILSLKDKVMGTQVQEYEIRGFKEFTEDCNISKLPAVGRSFT